MLLTTSKQATRTVVHPDDPAINQEASNVLEYRKTLTDEAERAHLVYKEGCTPYRWSVRALDAVEYDDTLCDADATVQSKHLDRRMQLYAGRVGLCKIQHGETVYKRGSKEWSDVLARVPHDVQLWLGGRVVELSKGIKQDHMLRALLRLSACEVALRQVVGRIEEEGSLHKESPLYVAARGALQLADAGEEEVRDLADPKE